MWLCDNSATSTTELEYGSMVLSELGVPTYYNVPQWSANAVYCDGIGKQNEFNREYSNICFSNGERMEDPEDNSHIHPAFEGELNTTEKSDGRITTYGLALYAQPVNRVSGIRINIRQESRQEYRQMM